MKRALASLSAGVLAVSAVCAQDLPAAQHASGFPTVFQSVVGGSGGNLQRGCARAPLPAGLQGVLAVVGLPAPTQCAQVCAEVWSYSPRPIRFVALYGSDARQGFGIHFHSMIPLRVPKSGALRQEYPDPDSPGVGPILMSFEGFDEGECAAFRTEFDAYSDPGYEGDSVDWVGGEVDVVFEGDVRAAGRFQLCDRGWIVPGPNERMIFCEQGQILAVVLDPVRFSEHRGDPLQAQ